MKALAIAGVDLRRTVRDRANIFFLVVLPMLIILLLGAAFGGAQARLGVIAPSGELSGRVVRALEAEPNLQVERFDSVDALRKAVERGEVDAGAVVPAALPRSGTASVRYFARPDGIGPQLRTTVAAAVAGVAGVIRAARVSGGDFDAALGRATAAAALIPRVTVRVTDPDGAPYPDISSRFQDSSSTQLVLFIFFTSLTGAGALIETRRLGVARRMLSAPVSVRTVLFGAGLGRFGIALMQALLIMIGATLLGVSWGNAPAALALVLVFCLVASGAGLLLGSLLSNAEQAQAAALLTGLGLAALGGSMVPLEVFPDTMRTIAHVTPHAWANDGFSRLLHHDGTLTDIAGDLAILLAYAAVLLTLSTWLLRRALTR
jgi:linearmycin/streptolysin S transport system permease protein